MAFPPHFQLLNAQHLFLICSEIRCPDSPPDNQFVFLVQSTFKVLDLQAPAEGNKMAQVVCHEGWCATKENPESDILHDFLLLLKFAVCFKVTTPVDEC